MADKRPGLGAGWVMAILGTVTGAASVALGFILRRSIGIVLIILAVSYAISQVKGDLVGVWQDWNRRAEAQDVRQQALEAERLKLEAELKQKQMELEKLNARIREREVKVGEKMVDQAIKENKVIRLFTDQMEKDAKNLGL
jgi:hypothetical protein